MTTILWKLMKNVADANDGRARYLPQDYDKAMKTLFGKDEAPPPKAKDDPNA